MASVTPLPILVHPDKKMAIERNENNHPAFIVKLLEKVFMVLLFQVYIKD
jgi:hypothetical protein